MSIEEKLNDKNLFPSKKWELLKEFILEEAEKINLATTWEPYEPEWWLEMMQVQRICCLGVRGKK
jgi:hypothetical protein